MMLALEHSEDQKKLQDLLALSVPESIKVYGTVFFINRGNPLNMEVLVDSWPDFKTVICKKRAMEMADDTKLYPNVYFVYTKDPENLREILCTTDVINWNQCLQIEGLQYCIDNVIMSIAGFKELQVERQQELLFVRDIHLGDYEKIPNVNLEVNSSAQTSNHLKTRDAQPEFKGSPLRTAEAELVNTFWVNGGNESSLKIVHQCIEHLPALCFRDPAGKPISWCVMDQSAELRMAFTQPEYRGKGLTASLCSSMFGSLRQQQDDFPFHFITGKNNVPVQKIARAVDLWSVPSGFFQWLCRPEGKANK